MTEIFSFSLFILTMLFFASIPVFARWYVNKIDREAWKRTRESETAMYKAIAEWRKQNET